MRQPQLRTVIIVGTVMVLWHLLYFATDGAIARF
jgi:hypothetical protein